MGCHWNVMILDVIFWHLFWLKKTSKFYGNVMTFWWNSTGFLWEKGIPVNAMRMSWNSNAIQWDKKFWFILMVFLWEKSMELSWNLTSFSTKTPIGINDGILLWGRTIKYCTYEWHDFLDLISDFKYLGNVVLSFFLIFPQGFDWGWSNEWSRVKFNPYQL